MVALALLAVYVVIPAILGASRRPGDAAVLPGSVGAVLFLSVWELCIFGGLFLIVMVLARLGPSDLRLRWRGGWWIVPASMGWSVALRLAVGLVLGACLVMWRWATGAPESSLEGIRPHVEAIVDIDALRDPAYLLVMLTVVSFVLAGLREELWRSGMIRLLGGAVPRWFGGRSGAWLAIVPVAIVFGLGHTPQGPAGIAVTTLLGIGLGAILVLHDSIWAAVLAHGFFNAATFAVLPLLADRFPEFLR